MNYFLEPFMYVCLFIILFPFLHQMFILSIFNYVKWIDEVLDNKIY
jgi:hypothetical protein